MIGRDPLARAPKLLDAELVSGLEGGPPVADWIEVVLALERGEGQVERELQELEDEFPATAVVALSRGYRLRVAENQLANLQANRESLEQDLALLLTPLQAPRTEATLPRTALQWMVPDGPLPEPVRAYGDRWVLTAWLHDPDLPLAPVGETMRAPMYDGLRDTPIGQLAIARAEGRSGDPEAGLASLSRATDLALQQAAADRDSEQAAWSEVKRAAAAELGSDDPIVALLRAAHTQLVPAAGDERGAGGALLASAALRWLDACAVQPCTGVDRVATISTSARWHPEVAALASTWRVIALKDALDTMDVAHGTVLFPSAMVALVDAVLGTGGGPMPLDVLRRQRPDPAVWLALGRSVGTEGVTDWPGAREALGRHLEAEIARAREPLSDEAALKRLDRIARRAIP